MDLHYNAFISYKHAPADIAVAKDIQHQLEHFHVPKAIRAKTGRNKIERIFRDQEELPITSDLNNDIAYALEDAEFLIVICSSSTKLSTWVPREIAKFLETHDRNHVLTVLVDGEPNDVIPEILRKEVTTVIDENGNPTEQIRVFEPLSCDYREGIRQARKTEIPRLAAALLGCSYDELVMRARQYKMRRLTAIGSVIGVLAAGFIAYLLWSNHQIQQNLRQAQINQSVYLANEASDALDNENRILAVQLAMAALPSEDRPDWPYVPEAEYVLQRAIDAYGTQTTDTTDYAAVWNMTMRGTIKDYLTSKEDRAILAYDSTGDIAAWDLDTYEERYRLQTGQDIQQFWYLKGHYLAVASYDGLMVLNSTTGETIWTYNGLNGDSSAPGLAKYYPVEQGIYILNVIYSDLEFSLNVCLADLSSGEILFQSETISVNSPHKEMCLTEDGRYLIFADKKDGILIFYRCDLQSGEIKKIPLDRDYVEIASVKAVDQDHIIIYGTDDQSGGDYDVYGFMVILQDLNARVDCYDYLTGETIWNSGFTGRGLTYLKSDECTFVMDYTDVFGEDHSLFTVLFAGEIHAFDRRDGSVYFETETDDSMVMAVALVDQSGILAVLENGYISSIMFDRDIHSCTTAFKKNILNAVGFHSSRTDLAGFVVQPDYNTLQIFDHLYDEDFQYSEDAKAYPSTCSMLVGESYTAVLYVDAEDENRILIDLCDLETKTVVKQFTLQKENFIPKLVGFGEGERYLYLDDWSGDGKLYILDTAVDSEIDQQEVVLKQMIPRGSETIVSIQSGFLFCDAYDYSYDHNDIGVAVFRLSDNGLPENPEVTFAPHEVMSAREFAQSGKTIVDENGLFMVMSGTKEGQEDMQSIVYRVGDASYIDQGNIFPEASKKIDTLKKEKYEPSDPCLALSDNSSVAVFNYDAQLLYRIEDSTRTVMGMKFYTDPKTKQDTLLVAYSDHKADRFLAADGSFLGSFALNYYSEGTTTPQMSWTFTNDMLIMQMDDVINIIDLDGWEMVGAMKNTLGYSGTQDLFIKAYYSGGTETLQYFPRYTLDNLLEKAETFLRGATMTDGEKARYGIE
ncbi:MAG: TIR domain-containing protein [Firmicutes bacterium]|nr:TIR domain-containing protein [Bacillota bacterium]